MSLKDEILKAAYELFGTKGFAKTTIAEILKKAGASKGGFYHHFNSKEAILEEILQLYIVDVNNYLNHLYEDHHQDYKKVFTGVFEAINRFKKEQFERWPELMKMMAFPGSDVIILRMGLSFEESTRAFYTTLIEKGNHKDWETEDPHHVARVWTKELLYIYASISRYLLEPEKSDYLVLVDTIDFSEKLLINLLNTDRLQIKSTLLDYVQLAKEKLDQMHLKM
ncbi:MAG: TetR/AcrR family transcriptional regulator [Clostridia bacterium]|nr:TetR/AcrR family transcriptional regulator [Clostridia bacterium]